MPISVKQTTTAGPKPVSILLIEDNPTDVFFLRYGLANAGISSNLQAVPDGRAVLPSVGDGARPDVLVIDFGLPGETGLDVLQRIKADPYFRSIPAVLLSGGIAPRHREIALENGVFCFEKPFSIDGWRELACHISSVCCRDKARC